MRRPSTDQRYSLKFILKFTYALKVLQRFTLISAAELFDDLLVMQCILYAILRLKVTFNSEKNNGIA